MVQHIQILDIILFLLISFYSGATNPSAVSLCHPVISFFRLRQTHLYLSQIKEWALKALPLSYSPLIHWLPCVFTYLSIVPFPYQDNSMNVSLYIDRANGAEIERRTGIEYERTEWVESGVAGERCFIIIIPFFSKMIKAGPNTLGEFRVNHCFCFDLVNVFE